VIPGSLRQLRVDAHAMRVHQPMPEAAYAARVAAPEVPRDREACIDSSAAQTRL